MSAPHEEGAKITAHTVISPLNHSERFGRRLDYLDTADVGARHVAYLSRRLGVSSDRAQMLAHLVFDEVQK